MLAKKLGSGLIVGLLLLSGNAFAQNPMEYNSSSQQGQQGRAEGSSRIPPDSAISACSGKAEGTACEVSGPNGTKQGICAYTPDRKYYACKPNDMNTSPQLRQQ
ncbi:MAG: hypothetical protein WCP20_02245 [Desulfuromonadales bacterium]